MYGRRPTAIRKGCPSWLFFFGGFCRWRRSEPRYDGASMARKASLWLLWIYRLPLWLFCASRLSRSLIKASGKLRSLDQAHALKWVQKNISAFGGILKKWPSPESRRDLFRVSAQMVSPLSKNMIAGALVKAGRVTCPGSSPRAEAEKWSWVSRNAGYNSLSQLRLRLRGNWWGLHRIERFGFPSVIDGYFYPRLCLKSSRPKSSTRTVASRLELGWNSRGAFMQGFPLQRKIYQESKEVYPADFAEVLTTVSHGDAKTWMAATNLASDRFLSLTVRGNGLMRREEQQSESLSLCV